MSLISSFKRASHGSPVTSATLPLSAIVESAANRSKRRAQTTARHATRVVCVPMQIARAFLMGNLSAFFNCFLLRIRVAKECLLCKRVSDCIRVMSDFFKAAPFFAF